MSFFVHVVRLEVGPCKMRGFGALAKPVKKKDRLHHLIFSKLEEKYEV